jgi:hypothetical protein
MALDATNPTVAGIDKKVEALLRRIVGDMNDLGTCLAELRNLQGTGHGKAVSAVTVDSRHAGLAVNTATTLGLFLFQSHMKKLRIIRNEPMFSAVKLACKEPRNLTLLSQDLKHAQS